MDKLSELVARSEFRTRSAAMHAASTDATGPQCGVLSRRRHGRTRRVQRHGKRFHRMGEQAARRNPIRCTLPWETASSSFSTIAPPTSKPHPVAMQRRPASASASANEGNGAGAEVDAEVIGRYLDRFEQRNGAWKVAKRRVVSQLAILNFHT